MMILALTTRQFRDMPADILLLGCLESVKELKGWSLVLSLQDLSESSNKVEKVQVCKSMFKNLITSLNDMELAIWFQLMQYLFQIPLSFPANLAIKLDVLYNQFNLILRLTLKPIVTIKNKSFFLTYTFKISNYN